MISDPRTQDLIVVTTLIAALISSVVLVQGVSLYTGTMAMVSGLDVDLEGVTVSDLDPDNFDPANTSHVPRVLLEFRITVPLGASGTAFITSLTASLFLNEQKFVYVQSLFTNVPASLRKLYGGYNQTLVMTAVIYETYDKLILQDALQSGLWRFNVSLTLFYRVFDSRADSVRFYLFGYEGLNLA